MTLDKLIEKLQEIRKESGGEIECVTQRDWEGWCLVSIVNVDNDSLGGITGQDYVVIGGEEGIG